MGKGHSDRKKINNLIAEGKYKEARKALATSKERINKRGQKALSEKASSALEKHLESQIKLRRKLGSKKYKNQREERATNIKLGMLRSKEGKRRQLIRDTRRERFSGG